MPTKDPEVWRKNNQTHYRRNREWYIEKAKQRKKELRIWFRELKSKPCAWCGHEGHPGAMHFHHRDPSDKLFNVGSGVTMAGKQRILDEIAKCDLICADCHAELHDNRPL